MVDYPRLNQFVLVKFFSSLICIFCYTSDGFLDITQSFRYIPHSATASFNTRSRIRSRNPRSVTTSTWHPSISSRSIRRPLRSKRLRPGSISTKRSISLSESASPRATDPKIRTLNAPCLFAVRRMSSRFVCKSSSRDITVISISLRCRLFVFYHSQNSFKPQCPSSTAQMSKMDWQEVTADPPELEESASVEEQIAYTLSNPDERIKEHMRTLLLTWAETRARRRKTPAHELVLIEKP